MFTHWNRLDSSCRTDSPASSCRLWNEALKCPSDLKTLQFMCETLKQYRKIFSVSESARKNCQFCSSSSTSVQYSFRHDQSQLKSGTADITATEKVSSESNKKNCQSHVVGRFRPSCIVRKEFANAKSVSVQFLLADSVLGPRYGPCRQGIKNLRPENIKWKSLPWKS